MDLSAEVASARWLSLMLLMLMITKALSAACNSIAFPRDEWTVQTADGSVDLKVLEEALQFIGDNSHSIFATRCGRVFYQINADVNTLPVYSIGKTIVTTWVGILLGLNNSNYWTSLSDVLPYSNDPSSAEKALNISKKWGFRKGRAGGPLRNLKSFLTMTSAFGLGMHNESTRVAAYSNNAIEFLFAHVRRALLQTYGRDRPLTSALDFVELLFYSYLGGHQDGLDIEGQISGYGGGLQISARDLARIGLVYLSLGQWENATVINPEFATNSSTVQVSLDAFISKDFHDDARWNIPELSSALPFDANGHQDNKHMRGFLGYSYGLWVLESGKAFALSGREGNYVIVDSKTGLVVAILNRSDNHPYAMDYLHAFRAAVKLDRSISTPPIAF